MTDLSESVSRLRAPQSKLVLVPIADRDAVLDALERRTEVVRRTADIGCWERPHSGQGVDCGTCLPCIARAALAEIGPSGETGEEPQP